MMTRLIVGALSAHLSSAVLISMAGLMMSHSYSVVFHHTNISGWWDFDWERWLLAYLGRHRTGEVQYSNYISQHVVESSILG
jgi:hypothetical protein